MKKGGLKPRIKSAKDGVKVHSYYTVPIRGGGRPEIDTTRRGAKTVSKKIEFGRIARRAGRMFILLLIIAGGLYSLRLSTNPVVVVDTTPELGRSEEYSKGIQSLLESSPLYQTKLTFNQEKFIQQIETLYPEVSSISISIPFLGSRAVVHVKEAGLPYLLESNGVTYAVNDSGVVVGEAALFAPSGAKLTIRDESGVEVAKGKRVLRSDDAEFFARAANILSGKGREVTTIRITSVPREATLVLKDLPYVLKVYLEDSADTQMATFLSAEQTLKGRGEQPQVYMDLRAGEKVYWQ